MFAAQKIKKVSVLWCRDSSRFTTSSPFGCQYLSPPQKKKALDFVLPLDDSHCQTKHKKRITFCVPQRKHKIGNSRDTQANNQHLGCCVVTHNTTQMVRQHMQIDHVTLFGPRPPSLCSSVARAEGRGSCKYRNEIQPNCFVNNLAAMLLV